MTNVTDRKNSKYNNTGNSFNMSNAELDGHVWSSILYARNTAIRQIADAMAEMGYYNMSNIPKENTLSQLQQKLHQDEMSLPGLMYYSNTGKIIYIHVNTFIPSDFPRMSQPNYNTDIRNHIPKYFTGLNRTELVYDLNGVINIMIQHDEVTKFPDHDKFEFGKCFNFVVSVDDMIVNETKGRDIVKQMSSLLNS